jgi:hypothetical protein
MFGARLPFRLACLCNIFLVLANAHFFAFSINPINNYHIYRFNYFAFLIARTLVFRPPSSRSLLGCASVTAILVSAVLLSPLSSCSLSCASVTAVVLFSRLCFCHRRRQCSLSAVLRHSLSDPIRSSPSTAQKPVSG